MQEEQEPSVTDILSSIRQILSNKLEDKAEDGAISMPNFDVPVQTDVDDSDSFVSSVPVNEATQRPNVPVRETEDVAEKMENLAALSKIDGEEDFLLLTPQMQIEQPVQSPVSQAPVAMPMTPDAMQQSVQIQIQEWLDRHLPQMVERIVSEEVRRIFNKR